MDQDKKEFGTSGNQTAKSGQGQHQPGKGMAGDKPSGGTSVGSSTNFGSGGSGSSAGGASQGGKSMTDKPAGGSSVGSSTSFGSGGSGSGTGIGAAPQSAKSASFDKPAGTASVDKSGSVADQLGSGAEALATTATAGDKPPSGGPASGMSGAYGSGGVKAGGNGRHREAGRMAEDGIEGAKGMAGQLFGDVRHAAEEMLEERKERAAETVQGVAEALRRTAGNLKDENDLIARYAEQAADTVERFSDTFRERRLGDMVSDLDDFARRQPTLFLLGAVAAGFVVGRFMAASAERKQGQAWRDEASDAYGRRGVAPSGAANLSRTRGNA